MPAAVVVGCMEGMAAWRRLRGLRRRRHRPDRLLPASKERLRRHVEELCARGRSIHDRSGYESAAAYIDQTLQDLGLQVRSQPVPVGDGAGWMPRNILVRFGPDRAEGSRFVVGAHYDVFEPEGPVVKHPGADDNASGVAVLLEVARLLSREELDVAVELVAFANEEPPFFGSPAMGSDVHARSLSARGARVTGMLSLECLGYFRDEEGSQQAPPGIGMETPSRADFLAVVGDDSCRGFVEEVGRVVERHCLVPLVPVSAPTWVPGIDLSDHLSYLRRGWPAAMLTDTAMFRNPNYHRPTDRPETLDYDRMAEIAAALAAAVPELGSGRAVHAAAGADAAEAGATA